MNALTDGSDSNHSDVDLKLESEELENITSRRFLGLIRFRGLGVQQKSWLVTSEQPQLRL